MLNVKERKAHILRSSRPLVEWLLSLNTNNRPIRYTHVEWLQRAIEAGNFCLTGQGIGVSKDGVLLDGQHRLLAIQQAEYKPVDLLIVTGLDDSSQIYVDQHAKRGMADMLKLHLNKTVSAKMAAVATFMTKISEKNGTFHASSDKASLDDVVEYMTEHGEELGLIVMACGQAARVGIVSAIFHYAQKYDASKAYELGEQIKTGEQLVKTDPAYRLRDFMLKKGRTGGGSSATLNDYRFTISACVAHAQGRAVEVLRESQNWDQLPRRVRKAA